MSNKCFKVQDFGEVVTGNTPSTSKSEYWDGDYCFFSPFDFTNSPHCNKTDRTITKLGLECGRKIPINSVMVTCIASIGKLAINKKEGVTNQQINTILVNEDFDYNYVYYLLSQNIQKIKNRAAQTAVPIINKTDFCNINLYGEDDIDTQRHIAEILSTTDTLISQTEAIIAKYKSIKQGMLHDLFTRGIDVSTGKLRPTAQQAPHLYKESELGLIPREWEVKRLEEIGVMKKGANIPKYLLAHEGIGCVIYGQLYTTFENIIKNPITKIPKQEVKGMSPLLYGDILFTGSGETHEEIGKCAVLLSNEEVYAGGDIIILTLNEKQYKPYFGYLLNFEPIQKQKSKLGQGSSVIHIYSTQLGAIKLALPKKDEQELIYSKIDAVSEKLESEQLTLSKYQSIKKGLMKRLLEPENENI